MFTGIVEEVGTVAAIETEGTDARLQVRGPLVTSDARLGDSISVSGVCLTVTELPGDGTFWADVMPETLRRSALSDVGVWSPVNLERALPVGGRYGGHVVQGHVDGIGVILSRTPGPRWDDVEIGLSRDLARYVAEKGSIAVSGISLTVTHVTDESFGVSLIPTTLEATTLGTLAAGARVNLERAARADTRLGGHLVQGHVDATTTVDRVEAEGESHWIGMALPPEFAHLLVSKGSVAVNGVSLTVAHLEAARFEVMIIPFTWEHTNLSGLQVGSAVNLECDMVGKYVARAVEGFRSRW